MRVAALLIALIGYIACSPRAPRGDVPILLFTGGGTSVNDVAAVEAILKNNHFVYTTANARQLNRMSESRLAAYRLIIVPGGNFIDIGNSLTPSTLAHVRGAVQRGTNYLGICAGAFLAGHGTYNSFNLTSGVRFNFYSAEARGIRKASVVITGVNAAPIEQYWEDGPDLTGWGDIVGKYPDGNPAVVQGRSGKGWVILAGTHPEAPERWQRGLNFTTPASVANAYAATLVDAALNGKTLSHY